MTTATTTLNNQSSSSSRRRGNKLPLKKPPKGERRKLTGKSNRTSADSTTAAPASNSRRRPPPSQLHNVGPGSSHSTTASTAGSAAGGREGPVSAAAPSQVKRKQKSGRRRKKKKSSQTHRLTDESVFDNTPKCLVIGRGLRVSQGTDSLVHDLRSVLLPWSSKKLKTHKKQTVKDFIAVAKPLGLTHLQILSQSDSSRKTGQAMNSESRSNTQNEFHTDAASVMRGSMPEWPIQSSNRVYWRICGLPTGPTLTFEVLQFSLQRDVKISQRRPRTGMFDFQTSPLVVLNGFRKGGGGGKKRKGGAGVLCGGGQDDTAVEIMRALFANLFPCIDVQTMKVSDCRRVVLFNHFIGLDNQTPCSPASVTSPTPHHPTPPPVSSTQHDSGHFIEFRHYAICKRSVGAARSVRKLVRVGLTGSSKNVPDLGNNKDIADYIMFNKKRGGESSDSEFENVTEVRMPKENERDDDIDKARRKQEKIEEGEEDGKDDEEEEVGEEEREDRRISKRVGLGLKELGPRMLLRLMKIEEEVCTGAVVYHDFIRKTPEELKELAKKIPEIKRRRKEILKKMEEAETRPDDKQEDEDTGAPYVA
eukprot:GHVQ01043227.1.p1 GENE.GHVQ01043227.1~~GHVQ01043227.1.p1  ORF type:complete len:590 (-),score=127.09 GHVQ01043227.1:1717-3486(-)